MFAAWLCGTKVLDPVHNENELSSIIYFCALNDLFILTKASIATKIIAEVPFLALWHLFLQFSPVMLVLHAPMLLTL